MVWFVLFSLTVTFKFQEMYPKGYFQLIKHISMIVKINKKTLLVLRNRTYIYTQFDAQNAGNSVSELPDFKFFLGGMPPDHPSKRGPAAPCQYHRLLSQTGCLLQTLLKPLYSYISYWGGVPYLHVLYVPNIIFLEYHSKLFKKNGFPF